ncbi:acyltransferase [Algoriphagus sp. A40]|uniref:acyltransferase n=1 Tax=Algoriphagus sp. A40 TaxID=1945863 RepID=UPI0009853DE7|nr:acyltransferase [Algoriphagus sp. A40]OOG68003.1 hypothetical protein B0E43_22700 [Algoriphagus sp. A40]
MLSKIYKHYKKMTSLIFTWMVRRKLINLPKRLIVNGFSSVNSHTYIGDFSNLNGLKIHGVGEVRIGKYFHSGYDCLIISSNHNYKGASIPYDSTNISKPVSIGDFVWMGSKVIVLGGVNIGEGAIIQAGAVVIKDVPPLGIAGGNPAVTFAFRDKTHFEKMKTERNFF